MAICQICGSQTPDEKKFCQVCGNPQSQSAPQPQSNMNVLYCPVCNSAFRVQSAPTQVLCPACNRHLSIDQQQRVTLVSNTGGLQAQESIVGMIEQTVVGKQKDIFDLYFTDRRVIVAKVGRVGSCGKNILLGSFFGLSHDIYKYKEAKNMEKRSNNYANMSPEQILHSSAENFQISYEHVQHINIAQNTLNIHYPSNGRPAVFYIQPAQAQLASTFLPRLLGNRFSNG